MNGRFFITAGPLEGTDFEVGTGESVLVGRASGAKGINIADSAISKVHCKIVGRGGQYHLEDLGSRNGVLVNRVRVERHLLREGDTIKIGKTVLEFRIGGQTSIQTVLEDAPVEPLEGEEEAEVRAPAEVTTGPKPATKSSKRKRRRGPTIAQVIQSDEEDKGQEAFGRIAIVNQMISSGDLEAALAEQAAAKGEARRPIGEILVERGALDSSQLDLLLKIQDSGVGESERGYRTKKKEYIFAKLAIKKGFVPEKKVVECMRIQRECAKEGLEMGLEELLEKKGLLTRAQLEEIFRQQSREGVGDTIEGYEILEMIGHGGMGAVYRARQKSMDRLVAIKILSEKVQDRPEFAERFLQEARTVARLNHENIISGIDFGKTPENVHYFVMEYVEGPSVLDILREHGSLPAARCIDIGLQVARALDHAHRKGLVHQDIKPDNVMLGEGEVVKLCDLGLAKTIEESTSGRMLGTANYMSPEQVMGNSDVDIRSDIYSLGVTLYRMLFGRLPYRGSSPAVVMSKHLNEPVSFPNSPGDPLSRSLVRVIEKMMAKQREDRVDSPTALLKALETLLEESDVEVKESGGESNPEVRLGSKRRRRRRRRRRR